MNNLMIEARPRKTYHIDRTWRQMAGGSSAASLVVPVIIYLFQVKVVNGSRESLAAMFLVPGLFLLLCALQWHVAVTPLRFEYNLFPFAVKIAWVDMIRLQPGRKGGIELVYRQTPPRIPLPAFILKALSQGKADLTMFVGRWYYDRLSDDFKQYAPHLFSDDHLQSTSSK
jgi:hypothetical protein